MLKKIENFWYHNKGKTIAAVFIIIAAVFILKISGGNIKPDLEIAYVTNGPTLPEDAVAYVNEQLAGEINDINKDRKRKVAFTPLMGPRVPLEFVSGEAQIVLMDGNTLGQYIGEGIFEALDDFNEKYKLASDQYPQVKLEGTGGTHDYAIPLDNIPFLTELGFPGGDYYLAVRTADEGDMISFNKNKNALAVLDVMLENK